MRKTLIIALGLASLGGLINAKTASAGFCEKVKTSCQDPSHGWKGDTVSRDHFCNPIYAKCLADAKAKKAAGQRGKEYLDAARNPGGILQHGGTAIIKEDVNVSRRAPSHASTSTTTSASTMISHPIQPALSAQKPINSQPATVMKITPPAQIGNPRRQAQ